MKSPFYRMTRTQPLTVPGGRTMMAPKTCKEVVKFNWIRLADFYRWNPSVGPNCDGLTAGKSYCVEAYGESEPTEQPATAIVSSTSTSTSAVTTKAVPSTTKASQTTTTTTTGGGSIETPNNVQENIVNNCNKFHLVEEGDLCAAIARQFGISISLLVTWNGLNDRCTNLWADGYACVSVIGFTPTITTKGASTTITALGNGIETPPVLQPGMVSNCNKFPLIKDTTNCQGIADYNKITLADFYKWNPKVNIGYTNLFLGAYACASVIRSTPEPEKPTTTKSGNGIKPPDVQPGMVSNCNKFHVIGDTTTCQGIVDYNKITMANFRKWNTGINAGTNTYQARWRHQNAPAYSNWYGKGMHKVP